MEGDVSRRLLPHNRMENLDNCKFVNMSVICHRNREILQGRRIEIKVSCVTPHIKQKHVETTQPITGIILYQSEKTLNAKM